MGWYLVVPPYVWPYNRRDLRVPVSRWKVVRRFDIVSACEFYLQEMKDDQGAEGLKKRGEIGIGLFALKVARASSPTSALREMNRVLYEAKGRNPVESFGPS
jgi:hypothetical protein